LGKDYKPQSLLLGCGSAFTDQQSVARHLLMDKQPTRALATERWT